MKKFIIGFVIGIVLGGAVGSAGMLVAFPFLFPPPEVNERVEGDLEVLFNTRLRPDSPGQDSAHWGRGGLKVYQGEQDNVLLELGSDFEVGPGPNFWLYLNAVSGVEDEAGFLADTQRVRLTKLKSFRGSQVYSVDAQTFSNAKAVTIWCESFDEYIASADIN